MITRLAEFVIRRRKAVVIASLVLFVIAGAVGGNVANHLNNGGFDDPSAESVVATNILDHQFHAGDPGLVLVVTAKHGSVDSPAVVNEGKQLTALAAAQPKVVQAFSY